MSTRLHIDESGHFHPTARRPADLDVVVAAYGLPADVAGEVERAVRGAARRRFPFLPWPLRRAYLFEPCWLVLCQGAWEAGRELGRVPALARATGEVPRDDAGFAEVLKKLGPWVEDLGLHEDWHALMTWGARQGFRATGPGTERLTFCRLAGDASARARTAAGRATASGLPGKEAFEEAIGRLIEGLPVPVERARDLQPILFPGGVTREFRAAAGLIQHEALKFFEVASGACDGKGVGGPVVYFGAEAVPGGANGEPDRYLVLLETVLRAVARGEGTLPADVHVEGRWVTDPRAAGLGVSGLREEVVRSLIEKVGGSWGEVRVYDKSRAWTDEPERIPKASQAIAGRDEALGGAAPGLDRHSGLQADRERREAWPAGLVLADATAFELRYRLDREPQTLVAFASGTLHASVMTGGRLHAGAWPGPSPEAPRPWARRLP